MFEELLAGVRVAGPQGAIRIRASYQPVGGSGSKVAPPTYPGDHRYLFEERYLDGESRKTVVIDSVQSQANRLEEAVLDAVDDGLTKLPYLETTGDIDGHDFRVTSLDAPHRSPDAYFRDSETSDGVAFDDTEAGAALRAADERSARAIFQYSPTDLVLGAWDSQRGGRGLRLPRAYTSEMIGLDPIEGVRGAGRLDPYNIPGAEVHYIDDDPSTWALDRKDLPSAAKPKKGKASNVNHGNALAQDAPGGVAVTAVQRVAVVSLKVLRRLRFPDDAKRDPDVDVAARAVLAALAVLGDRLAFADSALFLRSGCDLIMQSETAEWISRDGPVEFDLPSVEGALELFADSVTHADKAGISFADPVRLQPKANLRELLELTLARPSQDDE